MPQSSIAYAVGRVRATARKPLGEAQLERLLSAASYPEALHLLVEMGWPESDGRDVERLSINMLEEACHRLREITPDPALTDAFLLRHDAQNLKSLFKARILETQPERLSGCGTIALDTLQHAVTEHDYRKLPAAFSQVMEALEKRIVLHINPMEIDVQIDKALYSMIFDRIQSSRSTAAKDYFKGKVDLQNAVSFLRLNNMQTEGIALKDVLLPGGTVSEQEWLVIQKKPEKLLPAFSTYPKLVKLALSSAQEDSKRLPALEKAADDHLLSLFRPHRYEPFAIEVLIGWLLAHEREAGAVRLIMAGKLNDFKPELIRERLREAYGQ
ncbi:MAG: V-type ATPase subunit [Clostridiales bacterium]|nr:V-type ATPase subunit [Clostridiales bacterium]